MLRFAANLSVMFTEYPFERRFSAAAAAGFRGVECLFPYDYPAHEVAGWLADAGLELVLFNLPPGQYAAGDRGLAAMGRRENEFRQSVEKALVYAKCLGTPRLHAMAGLSQHGADHETYVSNLRAAAAVLAEERIELLIEPINSRDVPGYFLQDQNQALAIIDEVGAPNLRLQCDLYHLQVTSGDLSMTLRRDLPQIGHIQIAGVPHRHEPDTGEINYAHLFAMLDALDYSGWIGCEYQPAGRTNDGLGWLEKLYP